MTKCRRTGAALLSRGALAEPGVPACTSHALGDNEDHLLSRVRDRVAHSGSLAARNSPARPAAPDVLVLTERSSSMSLHFAHSDTECVGALRNVRDYSVGLLPLISDVVGAPASPNSRHPVSAGRR